MPIVPSIVVNIVLATIMVASYSRLPSMVTSLAVISAVVDAVVDASWYLPASSSDIDIPDTETALLVPTFLSAKSASV